MSTLSSATYGKTKVGVFRVVREQERRHVVVEYNVTVLLEGEIGTSFTNADNGVVVATDSIKNIIYYLAKISPLVLSIEQFGIHLGLFFVWKYSHITKASVSIEQLRWKRMEVVDEDEKNKKREHGYAFWRDGEEKRNVDVVVVDDATSGRLVASVSAGLSGLLVLKSTGSRFEGFVNDEFTTLIPVHDRIFSTSIDLTYTFKPFTVHHKMSWEGIPIPVREEEEEEEEEGGVWDEHVASRVRKTTMEVFAMDDSASVQATLYQMGQRVIAENRGIQDVQYTLPNQHYIPVDMRYVGLDNLTPAVAEVFCPIAAPSGLISAKISRQ
ncbi:hypothetical protein Ac2012v2_002860 [Leucoagaricus gongylophorus]